jgi:ubiquinone/menaquinone biosynthesis C-methylase UbiE
MQEAPLLDVGCGNGLMLKDLHDMGYRDLTGVDYSEASIALCRETLRSDDDGGAPLATLVVGSVAALPFDDGHFAIVHDKGTYDAWRLGDNDHATYMREVWRVLPVYRG